jgi:hypothetical protein
MAVNETCFSQENRNFCTLLNPSRRTPNTETAATLPAGKRRKKEQSCRERERGGERERALDILTQLHHKNFRNPNFGTTKCAIAILKPSFCESEDTSMERRRRAQITLT